MRKTIALIASGLLALSVSAAALAGAPETFAQKCAGCHGKDMCKGQTTMGKKLSIKGLDRRQGAGRDQGRCVGKSPSPKA